MSENETLMVGIVSAEDGSFKVVISAPKSPPLLGAKTACGAKGVPITDAVSRTPPSLSDYTSGAKDASVDSAAAAAEPEPAADTVDSDTAKAIFAAHEPSANADFWSKLARPTDPPTAPNGVTENDPVLKPVTKVATALKPAAAGGAPLPSMKEFPEEKPAQAGDADWTVSTSRNKTEPKGEVKSTKVFNKYDLLDDAETNVKAEADEDEDEDEKGKEKGASSGKQPSFESVSPESVSPEPPSTRLAFGFGSGFGFGKLCSSKLLCIFFTSVVVIGLGCSAFALSSKSSGGVSEHYVFVPDATAVPVVDFSNITPESMALPTGTAIPNEVATSPAASESQPGHVLDATLSVAVPQDQPTGRSTTFASLEDVADIACPLPAKDCSFVQGKRLLPYNGIYCNDLASGNKCSDYYEICPPQVDGCPINFCPCIDTNRRRPCRGANSMELKDVDYLIAQCSPPPPQPPPPQNPWPPSPPPTPPPPAPPPSPPPPSPHPPRDCSENKPSQTCKGFCATSGPQPCKGSCSDKTNKDHGYYCCCSEQGADLAPDCGVVSEMAVDGKWHRVSGTDKPDFPYEVEDDPFYEKGYECDNTFDKVKKKLKDEGVPPLGGEIPFSAGWAFANATAEWAREVLGFTKEDMPLHYAFYTNGNRSFDHECNQPDSKIFASCEFLHSQAEAPEQLGEFAIDLLNMTDADIVPGDYWTDYNWFNDSVLNLSFTAFAKFINYTCGEDGIQTSKCNNVCVPGSKSPQPSGDCGDFCSSNTCSDYEPYDDKCSTGSVVAATDYDSAGYVCCCNERTSTGEVCGEKSPKVPTLQEFAENNDYRPFFGSSSGGGKGGSLKVSCVGKAGFPKDILVSAGGGGGGGYTSPQMGEGMDAGGGAGAGAQIGAEGCAGAKALVGAGAGNHPAGFVEVHKRVSTPAEWVALLDEVKDNMTDCWNDEDKDLVITGEGSGGFGFQHLYKHDVLSNSSDVEQNQTLSIGFRFAFAMGQGNDSLIKDTQAPNQIRPNSSYISGAKAYVVCECNGKGDCKDCVSPVLYPDDGNITNYGCAGIISTLVCRSPIGKKSRWEDVIEDLFPNRKKPSQEETYKCCEHAVKNLYMNEYNPSDPGQNNTANPFCPAPNETSYQKCDDPAILVTEDMIEKVHPKLCPTPDELKEKFAQSCKPLPGC